MKTILLILSLTLSASAATLYPVLTDNAVRTFSGGGTNLALLNTNQTYTGTPTFPAAVFSANQIRARHIFVTNLFANVVYATNAASAGFPTNQGESVHATVVLDMSVPALQTTNSIFAFTYSLARTNTQTSGTDLICYAGDSTNCVYYFPSVLGNGTSSPLITFSDTTRTVFNNYGSLTNQFLHPVTSTGPFFQTGLGGTNLLNTATNWNFKIAFASRAAGDPNTNLFIRISLMEIAMP